jgi:hypothetical protein
MDSHETRCNTFALSQGPPKSCFRQFGKWSFLPISAQVCVCMRKHEVVPALEAKSREEFDQMGMPMVTELF